MSYLRGLPLRIEIKIRKTIDHGKRIDPIRLLLSTGENDDPVGRD